jgi:hypothetical protein
MILVTRFEEESEQCRLHRVQVQKHCPCIINENVTCSLATPAVVHRPQSDAPGRGKTPLHVLRLHCSFRSYEQPPFLMHQASTTTAVLSRIDNCWQKKKKLGGKLLSYICRIQQVVSRLGQMQQLA